MDKPYRLCVSSPPDRERVVVEIFFGSEQWAELNQEGAELELEIYPRENGEPWKLALGSVHNALAEAKSRLSE